MHASRVRRGVVFEETNSVAALKSRAEKYYAGISSKWIKHDASTAEVAAYKAALIGYVRCSFCSRNMFEVESLLEGDAGARICNLCVRSFYRELMSFSPLA